MDGNFITNLMMAGIPILELILMIILQIVKHVVNCTNMDYYGTKCDRMVGELVTQVFGM